MISLTSALSLTLALSATLPSALAFDSSDARSRSVYQLVTDRFALSNDSSSTCDTSARTYCGGSYTGISNHLDYIKGMGFDTIWISPIVENIGGTTAEGEAYHGYWTANINNLNTNFGSEQNLKDLVTAVHGKGMYVMVDVVVNHVAATSSSTFQASDTYGPFNSTSESYHPFCWITDYTNQTDVEDCWLGDDSVALADINTESDYVVSTYNTWIKDLVSNYSFDAIRIDTVKHVRQDFWPNFVSSSGVFAVGEVLNGDASYTGAYQNNSMDSVFNYPIYYPLVRAFNSTSGSISDLASQIKTNKQNFKDTTLLGNFLDNHDNPRFESYTSDTALIKNAAAFPFVTDGIPYVYYGQEQGFTGGADPANREDLWSTAYGTSSDQYAYITKFNGIRQAAINASDSFLTNQADVIQTTSNEIVISKGPLLSVLTNRGSSASDYDFTISNTTYSANQALVELIGCTNVNADASGNIKATVSGGQPLIYIPQANKGSLCSDLSTSSSGNSSSGASVTKTFSSVFATLFMALAAWTMI